MAAEMSAHERFEAVIRLEVPDRVPVGGSLGAFAAVALGYTHEQWVFDPDAAENSLHEMIKLLGGWDVTGVFPAGPLSIQVGPMRMKLPGRELPPNTPYQALEQEVMTVDDYDLVIQEGYEAFEKSLQKRLGVAPTDEERARTVQRTRENYERCRAAGVEPILSGGASLPFDTFSFARSLAPFMMDLRRRPEKIKAACDAAIDTIIARGIRLGQSALVPRLRVAGTRASSDFVPPRIADTFYFPYLKKAAEAFVAAGITPVIHLDTNWTPLLDRFLQLPRGKCLVQLDGFTDIVKAKEILGGHMAIQGDVPPALLTLGTPEEVTAYCRKLIEVVGKGGGLVLAAGCAVPVDAKLENVRAMVNAAKTYGWYN